MKLNSEFQFVNLDDEIVAVPLNSAAFSGVLKLNKEAQAIIELLQQGMSEQDVVDTLDKQYETDKGTLTQYVHGLIESLTNAGLIEA